MPCINYRAFFLGCIHCSNQYRTDSKPDLEQIKALRNAFAYKLELMHLTRHFAKPLLTVVI